MKYFCLDYQRTSTAYHEFYRGKWNGNDFWNATSFMLEDNDLVTTKLYKAFKAAIPTYDAYDNTEVTPADWVVICEYANTNLEKEAQEALTEITPWINDVFAKEGLVTILGL